MLIETRTFYRKRTKLQGQYIKLQAEHPESMTVEDLSFTGIRFRTRFSHRLELGDMVQVTFVLDNAARSELAKRAMVRFINGRLIGAEFCDRAYDTELTYYLNAGQETPEQPKSPYNL